MKKLVIILIALTTVCLLLCFSAWKERLGCVCSILTEEETKHPLTTILNSVWDTYSATEGTFTRLLTTCNHGERISITIFTDDGYFVGYKVK